MAINKKLIHFKRHSDFIGSGGINGTTSPTNGYYGQIPANAIVFILDTKQIWTHGQYYNCPYTQEEITALLNNKANISDLDNYLTTKAASDTYQPKGNYITSIPVANGDASGVVNSGGDVTISNGIITVNDNSHNHTISAGATNDGVIVLTGTPGTNGVSYDAKHAKKFSTSNSTYTSDNSTASISGSGGSGTIKVPKITVDSYGHVTAAADESVNITMPTLPTALKNPNALTIGGQTYDGSSQVIITAADLGLSSALKYHGTTTTALTDGATTKPIVIGGSDHYQEQGCVVAYNNSSFVWTGSAWEELGNPGNYKVTQDAVSSPSASGSEIAFIDTISLDANGTITATKKNVQTASTSVYGITKLSSVIEDSEVLAATPKAVKSAYDLASSKWTYNADTIKAIKVNEAGTADIANSVDWTKVNNKPTNLSQFTDDIVAGKYLPLSGGTITSSEGVPLNINSIAGYTVIGLQINGINYSEFGADEYWGTFLGTAGKNQKLGIKPDGTPYYNEHYLIHSGNIGTQSVNYAISSENATNALNTKRLVYNHTSPNVPLGMGEIAYSLVSASDAGNLPVQYNANGVLTLNTHQGDYHHQLGFSSNGNIYSRHSGGTELSDSITWKQIAFTDSNVASSAKLSYTGDTFGGGELGVVYKMFQDASKVGAAGVNGDWSIPEGTTDSTTGCAQILRLSYGINNFYNDIYFGPNTGNGIWWRQVTDNVNQPWQKLVLVDKDDVYRKLLNVSNNGNIIAKFTSNSHTESAVTYIGSDGLEWVAGKGCVSTGDTFCMWSKTLGQNVLVCHATKRVSIGKNTADEALDVEGNGKFSGSVMANSLAAYDIRFNGVFNTSYATFLDNSTLYGLRLYYENGVEGVFFKLDGTVGIGTITPTEKLHVDGNVKVENGNFIGNLTGTADNSNAVNGTKIAIVSEMPSSPDSSTLYFVK